MTGRKYSLPSLVSYILTFLAALGILVSINVEVVRVKNLPPPTEGVDMSGLSVGILTLVAVLVLIYGAVVFLNLILKAAHVATDKWGFAIPCLLIDLVVLLVNGTLTVGAVNDVEPVGIAIGAGLVVLSLVSIISNILSIAKKDE